MKCSYTFPLVCLCPVDPKVQDSYRVTVRACRMVQVEHLLEAAEKYRGRVIFQEKLTAELAKELKAEVETLGRHSGVETVCVCGR